MSTDKPGRKLLTWVGAIAVATGVFLLLRPLFTPTLLRVALPAVAVGLAVWALAGFLRNPARKVRSLLERDHFERAFRLAVRSDLVHQITRFLETGLETPSPRLRDSVANAFTEVQALSGSARDRSNVFIDPTLKRAAARSCQAARQAIWGLCKLLGVVARQKIVFPDDHPKIETIAARLEELSASTYQARARLAELSLGAVAGTEGMDDARTAMDTVRRQSEALVELQDVLG